jgi:hypothetical protein
MDTSIFMDKEKSPTINDLSLRLKPTYELWNSLRDFVFASYPKATEKWKFSGNKYGWNYTISDKKRAIIYLLPRESYFKVAFVFGQKATNQIMESTISDEIKTELQNAKVYAEGRGIRIEIKEGSKIGDIKKLVEIKLDI